MNARAHGGVFVFAGEDALLAAVRRLRAAGHRAIEVHAPQAVPGLEEALALPRDHLPAAALIGGLVGGLGMLALQYFSAVIDYPLRVGGRPLASWPAFVPSALEMTLLLAAVAAVAAFLVGCRLPRLNHPFFDLPEAARASQDAWLLIVRLDHGHDDFARLAALLADLVAAPPAEIAQ